jgi:hypothetical protein
MAMLGRTQRMFPAACGPELVCSAIFSSDPERAWRYTPSRKERGRSKRAKREAAAEGSTP